MEFARRPYWSTSRYRWSYVLRFAVVVKFCHNFLKLFYHVQYFCILMNIYLICLITTNYLKERNFRVDLFPRVIIFNISREFNFANWIPVVSLGGIIFANLSFVNVSYILIFSWLVLQLVVCKSQNPCPNSSLFQIALFGYEILNSGLFIIL